MKTNRILLKTCVSIIKKHPRYFFSILISSLLSSGMVYYPVVLINKFVVELITQKKQDDPFSVLFSLIFFIFISNFWDLLIGQLSFFTAQFKRRNKQIAFEYFYSSLLKKVLLVKGDCLENNVVFESYIKCKSKSIPKLLECPEKVLKLIINFFSVLLYANYLRGITLIPALVIGVSTIIKYVLLIKTKKKQFRYDDVINSYNVKLIGFTEIMIDKNYLSEIKLYNSLDYLNFKRAQLFNEMHVYLKKNYKQSIVLSLVSYIIEKGIYFGSYLYYALMTLNKGMSYGNFVSAISSINYLDSSVSKIFLAIGELTSDKAYYQDYYNFLDKTPVQHNGCSINRVENISANLDGYTYSSNNTLAIKKAILQVDHPKHICIVGYNGSGKSTMANILGGTFEDYVGKYLINNQNSKEISTQSIINNVDICPQKFVKYPFSLHYNICFDKMDNDTLLQRAISESGISEFLNKLPSGLDSLLDAKFNPSGIDLSEGQWQRVLLARILYSDKNMIIFDEPTSALDPLAENAIFNKLLNINDKIVIVITHRMSCAKDMDEIYVFDKGSIVEHGTHNHLMRQQGKYYELFVAQSSNYDL